MKKKFIWLVLSCLMVVALILASCGPAAEEKGGTISTYYESAPPTWDLEDLTANTAFWANSIYDTLLIVDWWADRNIPLTSRYDYLNNPQLYTGSLAESWDWSDPLIMSFKIRKGAKWHNGREFVADDVVFHFERMLNNPKREGQVIQNIESVTATDKYTVVFKLKEPNTLMLQEIGIGPHLESPDVFEQYGNFRDWRTLVGTGPWIIEEYVPDTSCTYKRNPDYFVKDPEGNQLPYADYFKMFVISDVATQIAALRTAKVDKTHCFNPVPWDQQESLKKTNPDMQFAVSPGGSMYNVYMKTTKEPTSILKVRQALSMVVKRQELCDTLLGGAGHPLSWPADSSWPCYTPVKELPTNIRQIYDWKPENVEKAKQLLTEAGYPNGFEISCQYYIFTLNAPFAQGMEMLKAYWAEIGVDLELLPHDSGTDAYLRNIPFAYDDLLGTSGGIQGPLKVFEGKYRTGAPWNRAFVADSHLDELFDKAKQEFDTDKQNALYRELTLHVLEQCYDIAFPRIDQFAAWHPWVQGFSGESQLSYKGEGHVMARIWIDQALKEAMGK